MAATPHSNPPEAEPEQPTTKAQTLGPRARAREARRQGLLDAAEEVFAERGFAGATMAEIAARAGYSAGNLYNVFEGKDALFTEVLTTRGDEILTIVRASLTPSASLAESVDAYIDAILALAESHRSFLSLLTQTTADFDWQAAPLEHDGVNLRAEVDTQMEQVFLDAMSRGEIPTGDPKPYICVLHGSVNAHVARWVRRSGDRKDLLRTAPDLRRFIRRGLGLPAENA